MNALEARGLCARIGGRTVLHGVDLAIPAGRWTAIAGPNGAGKSTLLRALAGLLVPSAGHVALRGRPIGEWPRRERARTVAWLGQAATGADDLRVQDVAMLGRLPHRAWLAAPSAADHAAVERALRATHAWDWRDRDLGALSGGERQRVQLARALATEADVLLLDEPLANLDPPHQADWLALVRGLVARGGTVVSVLHELNAALHADALVLLAGGRVAHHGACGDGATHRALEATFAHRIAVRPLDGQWLAVPVV